jgi:predicted P-loop ATPase
MANKVIKLPVSASQSADADSHADADTKRRQRLFGWADALLRKLGLHGAVAAATSIEELHRITFNLDGDAEIALAIRDALFPASGEREEHFRGLKESGLKQVLKNRFTELKKTRQAELRGRRGKQPDWTDRLILNKDGKIVANLANLILILREAPKWRGVLGYDEFAVRVVVRKCPPWGEEAVAPWNDHFDSLTRAWLQMQEINAAAGDVGKAVQAAARHNPFHPVRDYFNSLVWDGVPRLDAWLVTHFHAEDTPYIRAIGPRYLISSVARIFNPGCKVDHTIILEGPQGKQKSEALRALVHNESWFTDRLSHVASKDAAMEIAGVQVIEIAEMDALLKAAPSAAKAFLTRRQDPFRPPYGRHVIRLPRQCVFAATINPPADGRYLTDPTGARRFWPVACRDMIDLDGLRAARDQLWAEAVARFCAGEKWWLETPQLEALATVEQDARFEVDPLEEPVREWVGDRIDVSLWDVIKHVLGFTREQCPQKFQKRVSRILGRMGFKKARPRILGERENRYQRDPVQKN